MTTSGVHTATSKIGVHRSMFVAEATLRDSSVAQCGDAMTRGLDLAAIRSDRRRPSGA